LLALTFFGQAGETWRRRRLDVFVAQVSFPRVMETH